MVRLKPDTTGKWSDPPDLPDPPGLLGRDFQLLEMRDDVLAW